LKLKTRFSCRRPGRRAGPRLLCYAKRWTHSVIN